MTDHERLLGLLPAGKDAALSARTLSRCLGISERKVGQVVAELRLQGHLVGSVCGARSGYFLAVSEADVEAGLAHLVSRAVESLRVARAVRRAAKERFGPEALTLFEVAS